MGAAILGILGFVCGATAVFFAFEPRRRRTEELALRLKRLAARLDDDEERLEVEPMERVLELSGASVPFPFDVHMMIHTENAPELEHKLHKHFARHQVNKVNPRKEFFRVGLDEIVKAFEELHGSVKVIANAEALQYRESLTMRPEDQKVIEEAYERVESKSRATMFEED